jgi:hypothetical protein
VAFDKAPRPRHCNDSVEAQTLDEIADRVGVVAKSSSRSRQGRVGNGTHCLECGSLLRPKRGSRRQRYCSDACRQTEFRARKWASRYKIPGPLRSVENNGHKSINCESGFSDRASRICGPAHVIQSEVFGNRRWRWITSPDGVTCEVSTCCERRVC